MAWLLSCMTPESLLLRNPASPSSALNKNNIGAILYPVLMAADVLSLRGTKTAWCTNWPTLWGAMASSLHCSMSDGTVTRAGRRGCRRGRSPPRIVARSRGRWSRSSRSSSAPSSGWSGFFMIAGARKLGPADVVLLHQCRAAPRCRRARSRRRSRRVVHVARRGPIRIEPREALRLAVGGEHADHALTECPTKITSRRSSACTTSSTSCAYPSSVE